MNVPSAGARYRERDPRFNRIIEVVEIVGDKVIVQTVCADDRSVKPRHTRVALARFEKAFEAVT